MSRPFFSIVMPAYNCEHTIIDTLESVVNQEWSDFECLIVNDGSTDRTQQVIEDYIQSDSRFKIINKENGGPGSARNKGIEESKGRYLFLTDSDDALPKATLKKYALHLNKDNPDLIVSSYQMNVMDENEVADVRTVQVKDFWISNHEQFLNNLHGLMEKQLMYVIWNKVYKLDIIKEQSIRFPHYSSCEDRLFNLQYYHFVQTCQVLSDVLYAYSFDGKNSLTNKYLPNKFETFEEFYTKLLKLTEKNSSTASALFLKGTMSCIIPFHSEECPHSFFKKRSEIKRILNHPSVKKAARDSSTDSVIRKIMAMLFKSRSVTLNYLASLMMYQTSQLSPKLIEKLKGNF